MDCQELVVVAVVLALYWLAKRYTYWWSLGVPTAKGLVPGPGHAWPVLLGRKSYHHFVTDKCLENGEGFAGTYLGWEPVLVVRDPALAYDVMVKDAAVFPGRGIDDGNESDPLNINILTATGDHWKKLRAGTVPAFSPAKVRAAYPIFQEAAQRCLGELPEKDFDAMSHFYPYFHETLIQVLYGVSHHSLQADPSIGARFLAVNSPSWLTSIRSLCRIVCPALLRVTNWRRYSKDHVDFLKSFFSAAIECTSPDSKNLLRLLAKMKKEDELLDKPEFNDQMVQANGQFFYLAALDGPVMTTIYLLYETAKKPHIQEKIYQELKNSELGPDTSLPYFDATISETLRLYPTLSLTMREAARPYKLPGTEIVLPKGQKILVPIVALHRDPESFQNPNDFDPERFLGSGAASFRKGSYMPFGQGPKKCIGGRLALLQIKSLLAPLLLRYRVSLSDSMSTDTDIETKPGSVLISINQNVSVKATPRCET